MNFVEEINNLNYLAMAIATIVSYVFGFIWYHWSVFGKAWANALGLTKEEADNTEGLGGAFGISLVSGLVKTVFFYLLMLSTNTSGVLGSAFLGLVVAIVFTVTSLGYYNGFARAPLKLTLINSAHSSCELVLVGAILGIFN